MPALKPPCSDASSRRYARAIAVVEVLLIFVLFFVLAGGSAPDVNESHYLGKAKHYWNPNWCHRDLFLQSSDAHLVFYWTLGWLTRFFSLGAVAWIGRCLSWLLLAYSWRRLSVAVLPGTLWSLLTAGLFAMLLRCTHMAGEWVIGGIEAKSFAFVFVFLGLESLVRNRWRSAWLLFGCASAFHVLVGGWSVVAAGFAWLATKNDRMSLTKMLPALALGGAISLVGLIPGLSLTSGLDEGIAQEAKNIYVHQRLPHHLLFHRILGQPLSLDYSYLGIRPITLPFTHLFFLRHVALIVAGFSLWKYVQPRDANNRLYGFCLGAIVIAAIGIVIDQATLYNEPLSASLMRYYWFRLSDAMVPIAVALLVAQAISKLQRSQGVAAQWCLASVIVLTTLNTSDVFLRRRHDPKPNAVTQAQSIELTQQQADTCYQDWLATCEWINSDTAEDALFLTPRHQQTFKWYAERAEVVAWKDIPQDAVGVVEWKRRIDKVFPASVGGYDLAAHGERELLRLAEEYEFCYVVIDRSRSRRRLAFVRVYPESRQDDSCFEVYRLPMKTE